MTQKQNYSAVVSERKMLDVFVYFWF